MKRNRSKFWSFAEGSPITVQLDDKGEVIDVHRRLELELAIAPMPHIEPGFRIGTPITIELNEAGHVIEIRNAR